MVKKIINEKNGAVRIECSDGASYTADHVVCTMSLGHLKVNHWKMFDPPLPEAKAEAIQKIGFGRVGKVFLEFDAPFWSEGEEGLKLAWGREAITESGGWETAVLGFDEVLGNPNVLVAWIGGVGAGKERSIMSYKIT